MKSTLNVISHKDFMRILKGELSEQELLLEITAREIADKRKRSCQLGSKLSEK